MVNITNVYVPAQTGNARIFFILDRARADHDLKYASHAKLTGVSRTHGEITPVEIPDPDEYGSYLEVDEISGQDSRYTATIVAKFPSEIRSILQYLDRCKEPFDLRLQFGECENPSDPTAFTKGEILEHVRVTGYSTDDFGSLQSDEGAEIRETLNISFRSFYDFVRMSYFNRAATLITSEVNDILVRQSSRCFGASCACNLAFAVTNAGGGSPGTAPDVLFTIDGGNRWYAKDINSLASTDSADGVADIGDYLVVIAGAKGIAYTEIPQFYYPETASWQPQFTTTNAGFVQAPKAIRSTGMKAFIVGSGGYVYSTENPASGVKVLDAGVATQSNLNAVAVYSGTHAVAVGDGGAIVYTVDGNTFHLSPTSPISAGSVNLTAVAMRKATEWIVGTSDGRIFITYDSGRHWSELFVPGTKPTAISDIVWQGESAGFLSAVVGGNGRIYRTLDAGRNWMVEPSMSAGSMPTSKKFSKLGICKLDVNQLFAVGQNAAGTGGIIVTGGDTAG